MSYAEAWKRYNKGPMKCVCAKCLSSFTEGSGPPTPAEDPSKDACDQVVWVCPGCRHPTTLMQYIQTDDWRMWHDKLVETINMFNNV